MNTYDSQYQAIIIYHISKMDTVNNIIEDGTLTNELSNYEFYFVCIEPDLSSWTNGINEVQNWLLTKAKNNKIDIENLNYCLLKDESNSRIIFEEFFVSQYQVSLILIESNLMTHFSMYLDENQLFNEMDNILTHDITIKTNEGNNLINGFILIIPFISLTMIYISRKWNE
ncbi:MAG: hypothetical protein ACXAAH_06900 [Promethearchaeota archaeon]|jgi:hypothetical protein